DYCNSLMYGIAENQLDKLQRIQNTAARLVASVRKCDHISPVLRRLHWLPVRHRMTFKIASLVYKSLHGLAPTYLSRQCVPVATLTGRSHLISAASSELIVAPTRTVRAGARPFSVCGS